MRASSQSRSSLRRELRSPPIGLAATLPVRRNRCAHRTTLLTPMLKPLGRIPARPSPRRPLPIGMALPAHRLGRDAPGPPEPLRPPHNTAHADAETAWPHPGAAVAEAPL